MPDRPKSKNYAYLRRTYRFMAPYWRQLIYFGIALGVSSLATLSIGLGLKFVIDRGLSAGSGEMLDEGLALLIGTVLLCGWIQRSKLGTLLLAMRDKEDRVRFSGYDVANFKVFAFCLAAALSAIGGAMFTLQVGFMSPSFVGIVPSIEMVIYAAVGGRMSLVGAVFGALLVNWGKTVFSESFPDLWLFLMAALFIGVTMAFPDGLAGVVENKLKPWWRARQAQRQKIRADVAAAQAAYPEPPAKATPPATLPQALGGQRA